MGKSGLPQTWTAMAVNVREFKNVPTALASRSPVLAAMWPL
jgi:hypothetical protein